MGASGVAVVLSRVCLSSFVYVCINYRFKLSGGLFCKITVLTDVANTNTMITKVAKERDRRFLVKELHIAFY